MRYSMASPCSATQGRCSSVLLQGWRAQGGGEGTALYEEPVAIARGVLRQSCDEGWRAPLLPCITLQRGVGEFCAWLVPLLSCLSSAWAPGQGCGVWRGSVERAG